VVLALLLLSMSFSALLYRAFSFLHLFLLLEGMLLALHLLFVAAAATTGTLDGEVMVLFSLAIAAAESAVGLALYRALVGGAPPRRGSNRELPTGGLVGRVSSLPLPTPPYPSPPKKGSFSCNAYVYSSMAKTNPIHHHLAS
jgi:NADH-quinone oxidoreductase subunit K